MEMEYKVGECMSFAEDPGPDWIPCDGRRLIKTAYPELFTAMGTNWGGTDVMFGVPNLGSSEVGPYYIKAQTTNDEWKSLRTYGTTRDGIFLRRPGAEADHKCILPNLFGVVYDEAGVSYPAFYVKSWVWMCKTCHHVYRLGEVNDIIGKQWHWQRMRPWNERRWRRRWEHQKRYGRESKRIARENIEMWLTILAFVIVMVVIGIWIQP